jgi:polygalacturonase
MRANAITVCVISALLAGTAEAALTTNNWIDPSSGQWETAGNWSLGVPSSSPSILIITNGSVSGKLITIDSNTVSLAPSSLTISNLFLSGPLSTQKNTLDLVNTGATPLDILNTLTISSGGSISITNSTLRVDGSGVAVSVSDDGDVLLNTGTFIATNKILVGVVGQGTLTISNGMMQAGSMEIGETSGAQGTLTLAGGTNLFSAYIFDGFANGATGTVWLTGGQLVVTNNVLRLGNSGPGLMTVSNGTWLTIDVNVGYFGQGTLTVAGGSGTLTTILEIGYKTGSTGSVWMTGGTLTIPNSTTFVGDNGSGRMTVSNGTWLANRIAVGNSNSSRGTLTVAGGTNTSTSTLSLGNSTSATGTVWITGGQLTVTNGTTAVASNGVGQLTVSNGTWLARDVAVGYSANSSQGTLTLAGGTNVFSSTLTVGSGSGGVGNGGTGTVWITGGQLTVTNDITYAGYGYQGAGQITMSNGTWTAKGVELGYTAGSGGTLTIAGGTTTIQQFGLFLGVSTGGDTGTVWLTGGQLIMTTSSAIIGNFGTGQMAVSNGLWEVDSVIVNEGGDGGTLTIAGGVSSLPDGLSVSSAPGKTGTVWMTGGELDSSSSAAVGVGGVGRMILSNGTWQSLRTYVGQFAGAQGTLIVAGGTNSVSFSLTIGNSNCSATGTVIVAGGSLFITNDSGTAVLNVENGTFTINSGTVVVDKFVMTNACAHLVQTGGTFIYSNGQPVDTDPPVPNIPTNNYNVTAFGAVGDGVSDNATAIQNTINAAAVTGGTVEIPANGTLSTYLCGSITLTNNENLQIDAGAMLQMLPRSIWTNIATSSTPFINGSLVHDVEISGSGTIDGQGTNWWFPKATPRPNFINFSGCTNVLVQGVTLQNPATFHIMAKGNNVNLTIQGVTENTPFDSPNTDGMDLASSNILVRSCSISVGDDNIEIGGSGGPVANMTVSNCTFGSGHGVSVGSLIATQFVGDVRGVHDLLVNNCTFNGTEYGIHMKSDRDRGGTVQNARYLDLTMSNVNFPIAIYAYYNTIGTPKTTLNFTPEGAATNGPQPMVATTPIWRNIMISNVTATAIGGNIAGIILGVPEMLASNITLCKVNLSAATNTFCIYNATDIQFIDSQLATPSGTNTLTLYNAQVTITNRAANPNVVTMGGQASPPTNNVLALFNCQAAITAIGMLGPDPFLTLAQSTLTVNNDLILGGASTLNFGVGSNAMDIAVTGNLTLGGTLNVADAGGLTTGTYALFTYSGALGGGGLSIAMAPAGHNYAISTNTPGQVNLVVTPPLSAFQAWQLLYFSSTNCALCGGDADFDGDGLSNTNEFLAGTNPANPASLFRVMSAVPQSNNMVITWTTAGGHTNTVQATAGAANGSYATNNFVNISGPIVVSGIGDTTTNYVDVGGATNSPARYYRVRLVP